MRDTYWGYWLIVLGIAIVVVMMLINNVTTTSSEEYYLIKEIAQASMVDAVDYAYYRNYSELRIHKEKFVESFIRRFAESVSNSNTYQIDFYDIYEAPPKVSVKVSTKIGKYNIMGDSTDFNIVEKVDAILEVGTQAK